MQFRKIISSLFLFKGIKENALSSLLDSHKFEIESHLRDDVIYSPNSFEKKVGFVLRGKCEVIRKRSGGTDVILNTLEAGDSFGILAVFSDEAEFPTSIVAKTKCDILFISAAELTELCQECPEISINVMRFMANRISFLNGKIATYSAEGVKAKLASFILHESERLDSLEISLNCKKCSEILGTGRASVYRAINSLVTEGLIKFDSKKINILDRKGLERTKK